MCEFPRQLSEIDLLSNLTVRQLILQLCSGCELPVNSLAAALVRRYS
jgi:hypothetical protein